MPFNLGFGEILVLAVIAILMFGGDLPDIARKVGRTVTEFKRGMSQHVEDLRQDVDLNLDRDFSLDEDPTIGKPPADWEPPPQDEDCPGMDR